MQSKLLLNWTGFTVCWRMHLRARFSSGT